MRFSNILFVLDSRHPGQAQALRHAAAFARTEGAFLTVCEVVDWFVPDTSRYTDKTVRILADSIRANKIVRLKTLVAKSDVSDLDVAVNVLIGKPHIEVARLVRENQHDLVIKPFAERSVIMRFFSAMQEDRELIRSCPCPVWLVNAEEHGDNKCVLAALDMPSEGDLQTGLNHHIVEASRSIALAESRPLHFVHAWHLRGEAHMRARRNRAADLEVDRMLAREAARRRTWLQNTVATPRSDIWRSATEKATPELHVIQGHAKKVIPDLAEKLGAGLIVMGTAARTGVSGILRRNTAETILPRSECSMLIVRQPESLPTRASEAKYALRAG